MRLLPALAAVALLAGCATAPDPAAVGSAPAPAASLAPIPGKPVIYQTFTRLHGNRKDSNQTWGTLAQNGVGKFADFDAAELARIRDFGATHLWLTGVPRHASISDAARYGVPADDPDVVKGRAGSPYAVTDYYDVDPDLASDPALRVDEFRALVARAHAAGLRVIVDLVPNHVARRYRSVKAPAGVRDFGMDDDTSVEYARDNSFYYVPGQAFEVPEWPAGYAPLGGEKHPLADGHFDEHPAKWTGNGARAAQPKFDDWYETVKLNFGVRPDGSHDFDALPAEYAWKTPAEHAAFWAGRDVPATWEKFRGIANWWLAQGVDGFRFDIAELVPVEFWSYLNSSIKQHRPDALLIAEIYNRALFRDFVRLGLMDAIYDKVDFYDTMKGVMRGEATTADLGAVQQKLTDIDRHLLRFLENHDEQRIASPAFAGEAAIGRPGMLVSASIGAGPALWYFGQEVGEAATQDAGFGKATRTTIFDYFGVPAFQRWRAGTSTREEAALREFHARLANAVSTQPALRGAYADLHAANLGRTPGYGEQQFAYARWNASQRLLVAASFSRSDSASFELEIPLEISANWHLEAGGYTLVDLLGGCPDAPLQMTPMGAIAPLTLPPRAACLYEVR